jgi:hypothetical protein
MAESTRTPPFSGAPVVSDYADPHRESRLQRSDQMISIFHSWNLGITTSSYRVGFRAADRSAWRRFMAGVIIPTTSNLG